ncbi:hypothetical protein MMC13_002346 [Lambiella insularis]|nr:hypothetical protein [Lambiella insularis]
MSSALPLDGEERGVEKRSTCNHDNVLRALLGHSASASPFCSTYLNIPTATVYAPGITPTPVTSTYTSYITTVLYPSQYSPYILPTYLYSYPTPSLISSACSCLSVPETTTTITTTPVGATTTVTTTDTYTGACATETPVEGAYDITSPESDAFLYDVSGLASQAPYPNTLVPNCCAVCSALVSFYGSIVQGIFGNCIGYVAAANGSCILLLQKELGAGYLSSPCVSEGFQPGTLYVNPAKYPYAAGGRGQCASTFTVVTT